jgi:hypothetical protein
MIRRRSGRSRLAACIVVLAALPLLSAAEEVRTDRGCTTVLPEDGQPPGAVAGTNLATLGGPVTGGDRGESSEGEGVLSPEKEPTYDWQLIDVYHGRRIVPESEYFALYFDRAGESLVEVPPEDPLTDLAHQALDYAPEWLYDDLYTNLCRFGTSVQDQAAEIILSASHPYVDEVAFQVAHISYYNFIPIDTALFEENARLIYDNDEYLGYVNVLDYGGPPGDYYSTAEYCVEDSGVQTWVEMPREIYYWYVVHPKCSDEPPKMDDDVYNEFWREFLFDYTHPDYLERELFDVLSQTEIVWDREEHRTLDGGRPFSDDDMALDVIGNWVSRHVPNQASSPRPTQPNRIITDHNGNCGELQDLLCAGTRTALIPCISAMNITEDHVWCEFWDEGWHPYQVSWGAPSGDPPAPGPTHIDSNHICYDPDAGGGKEVSGIWDWRNDHYNYQVIDRYSEYCTLEVTVRDLEGNLVDGAWVKVATESLYGGLGWTAWDTTDSTGVANFVLGDDDPDSGPTEGRDYYLRVNSRELSGGYPEGTDVVLVIDDAVPGGEYSLEVQLINGDTMPLLPVGEADPPPDPANQFKIEVSYELPWEYKFGENIYGTVYNYHNVGTGNFELFVCDEANYQDFIAGEPFEAHEIHSDSGFGTLSFLLPDNDRWYVVFSNFDQVNCAQVGDVTALLYIDQDALDIELTDFYARSVEEGVEIYWNTAYPLEDLRGWNLYRRRDGRVEGVGAGDRAAASAPLTARADWLRLNDALITGDPPLAFTDTGVRDGGTYEYLLEAVFSESTADYGPISAVAGGEARPSRYALAQNFPNPFAGESTIRYSLPERGYVRLNVYNLAGRLVDTLVDGFIEAGEHEVVWIGRDADGAPLPGGVYLYSLQAGDFVTVRRLVIAR